MPLDGLDGLGDAIGGGAEALGAGAEALGDVAGAAGEAIGPIAEASGEAIGGVAEVAGETIGNAAGALGDALGNALGGAAESTGDSIGEAAGGIGEAIGNSIGGIAENAGDALGSLAEKSGSSIAEELTHHLGTPSFGEEIKHHVLGECQLEKGLDAMVDVGEAIGDGIEAIAEKREQKKKEIDKKDEVLEQKSYLQEKPTEKIGTRETVTTKNPIAKQVYQTQPYRPQPAKRDPAKNKLIGCATMIGLAALAAFGFGSYKSYQAQKAEEARIALEKKLDEEHLVRLPKIYQAGMDKTISFRYNKSDKQVSDCYVKANEKEHLLEVECEFKDVSSLMRKISPLNPEIQSTVLKDYGADGLKDNDELEVRKRIKGDEKYTVEKQMKFGALSETEQAEIKKKYRLFIEKAEKILQ